MTSRSVYSRFLQKHEGRAKSLVVLVDPDKSDFRNLSATVEVANKAEVDFFFVGSSLLLKDQLSSCLSFLKAHSNIPVVLFPGNRLQISNQADALLLLSLISGRNPELLIGQHVLAAPDLKRSGLEIIPTGYMLIDGGVPTSVNYMSQTLPIPAQKVDIAVSTAIAGALLGMQLLYLEAGSGATIPVQNDMIKMVSENIKVPLIVGGGIREPETASNICGAGADIVVVGNGVEQDPSRISELADAVHRAGKQPYTTTFNQRN